MPDPHSISYDRHGSGEPLVLIHGLGATRRVWEPQIEGLAAERDVIALDMPGFGATPKLPKGTPATASNMGAAISDFLGTLGIERPHVAGNSLGGWVSLEIAKAGRAASACLISPAGMWKRPLGPRAVNTRGLAKLAKPFVLGLTAHEGSRASMLGTVVGHPDRVPPDIARRIIGDWIDAPGYSDANAQMRKHVFEDPEQVKCPVTIGWGELDRLVAPPRPERTPPGARYVVLKGCGHTPNWDRPELITEFLLESSSVGAGTGAQAA